jgi:hypothetical protein
VFVWKLSSVWVTHPPSSPLPPHSHSLPINEQAQDCQWIESDISYDSIKGDGCCTEPPEPLDVKDFDCLCAAIFGEESARTDVIDLENEKHLNDGYRVNTCGGALAGKVAEYVGGFDFVREESTTCEQVATKVVEFESFCGQETNGDQSRDADGNMPFYWDLSMKDASTNKCSSGGDDRESCESAKYTIEAPCEVKRPNSCRNDDGICKIKDVEYELRDWMTANDGVDVIGNPQTCWDGVQGGETECSMYDDDFFGGEICLFTKSNGPNEWSGDTCFDNTLVATDEEKTTCMAKKKSQVSFHPIGTSCLFGS